MLRGDTFLLPVGPQAWPHLWIVVTHPRPASTEAIVVSVTSLRNSVDQTTILRPGDHPFIRHDSVVHFGDARIVYGSKIDDLIASGAVRANARCIDQLIDEIESGLRSSPFTPKKILRFVGEHE